MTLTRLKPDAFRTGSRERTRENLTEGGNVVSSTIDAPIDWVESVGDLCLPPKANQRLQQLMDRNNEGLLTEAERADLETLVELSERLSLVRAEALHLLGRKPA